MCPFGADLDHGVAYAAAAFLGDERLKTVEILTLDGAVLGAADLGHFCELVLRSMATLDPKPPPGDPGTIGFFVTVPEGAFQD